ncbi:macrolide ABC transporter permease [Bacillus xiamenensis]|uniref:Macrolide ABC transporter permease n=1 Tax=Bacillus xiamenensis TaxID=1178537 RepID=A0AAC9IHN5_9BACI|nr:ABC transporter permease [Bacillus xiamenensis]AOZ89637.1 macrolide ABC transporter permease [Bacillus xiamenensis]
MKFRDQVKFIRRNMKKNRLRVFMTILATTMACSFLIVLASVGFGLQKSAQDEIMKQQIITEIKVLGKEKGDVKVDDLKTYDQVKSVVARTAINPSVNVELDDRSTETQAALTDMKEEKEAGLELDRGKVPTSANEIVVGYHMAEQLWTEKERAAYEKEMNQTSNGEESPKEPKGYTKEILNKVIQIKVPKLNEENEVVEEKTFDFRVVGVLKKPNLEWQQDHKILIPNAYEKEFGQILDLSPEAGNVEKMTSVYADKFDNVGALTDKLTDDGYQVISVTNQLEGMDMFFTVFKIGLIFVGCIAVIISAIGIFNTMTMAVTERTQEIGIMKAIGANPSIIKRMFLMESAYIGVIGSIIGIIISYVISFAVNFIIPAILSSMSEGGASDQFSITFSYIPLSLVITATVISAGVAIISGLNPARKATKTNVLTALRREN